MTLYVWEDSHTRSIQKRRTRNALHTSSWSQIFHTKAWVLPVKKMEAGQLSNNTVGLCVIKKRKKPRELALAQGKGASTLLPQTEVHLVAPGWTGSLQQRVLRSFQSVLPSSGNVKRLLQKYKQQTARGYLCMLTQNASIPHSRSLLLKAMFLEKGHQNEGVRHFPQSQHQTLH